MALSHALLTALIDDELSGYQLAQKFDTSLGFFWHASHQQIYRELKKLTQQGLLTVRKVAQTGKPDKLVYTLAPAGKDLLCDWIYTGTRVRGGKDELLVKLYNLSRDNAPHLALELQGRLRYWQRQLQLYEKIRLRHYQQPEHLPPRLRGIYLALAFGISDAKQTLQWCEMALATLQDIMTESAGRQLAGAEEAGPGNRSMPPPPRP